MLDEKRIVGPSVHESDIQLQSEDRQNRRSEEIYKETKGSMLVSDSSLKNVRIIMRISKILKNDDGRGKINYRCVMQKKFSEVTSVSMIIRIVSRLQKI